MLCKFHRKAIVLGSLFNRVEGLKFCIFIKKRLQHRCFPVKFAKFLKTSFLKNICERLLLDCVCFVKLSSVFSFLWRKGKMMGMMTIVKNQDQLWFWKFYVLFTFSARCISESCIQINFCFQLFFSFCPGSGGEGLNKQNEIVWLRALSLSISF